MRVVLTVGGESDFDFLYLRERTEVRAQLPNERQKRYGRVSSAEREKATLILTFSLMEKELPGSFRDRVQCGLFRQLERKAI
jgi:hypothetical protein